MTTAILELLALAGFGGVLLVFLAAAHRNATVIKGAELPFPSAVLVGCFLVPVANLLLPFFAVRSLWRGSAAPGEADVSTPETLKNWWALWVASCGFAFAWRWFLRSWSINGLLLLSWCATLSSVFAAIVVFGFVRDLDARQRAARQSTLTTPPAPA